MQVCLPSVEPQLSPDGMGTQPSADPGVHPGAREQAPVGRIVHEHHETELAGADDGHGHDERDHRRPQDVENHGPHDRGPRVEDESRAPKGRDASELPDLGEGEDVAGRHRRWRGPGPALSVTCLPGLYHTSETDRLDYHTNGTRRCRTRCWYSTYPGRFPARNRSSSRSLQIRKGIMAAIGANPQ